jgi:hypothetical protein
MNDARRPPRHLEFARARRAAITNNLSVVTDAFMDMVSTARARSRQPRRQVVGSLDARACSEIAEKAWAGDPA